MVNKLIGICRKSFTDDKGELVEFADFYILTTGMAMEGLEGDVCATYRVRGSAPNLKLGPVALTFLPSGKSMKLVDIQNV